MSFDAPHEPRRPTSGEAPFGFGETFYSRTDGRGVILAGNEVFRRVADYGWDRLMGAPHRLIRHPDMPKGVFWLLWNRIQAGKSTGAYVKNLARDGLHYWVYAILTPVEGGYLSVRIKPSSSLFTRVQPLYAEALGREEAGLAPAESAARLLDDIEHSGFADYDEFMATALFNEIAARSIALGGQPPERGAHIAEMHSLLRKALRLKHDLLRAFGEIRSIPTNLHIVASRLEVYGGPVSTIAENYRLMSTEVMRRLEEITDNSNGTGIGSQLQNTVSSALFHTASSLVIGEVERDYRVDQAAPGMDGAVEAGYLHTLDADYRREALAGLGAVSRAARALSTASEDLKRLLLGLDSIRVLCRVEAGRLAIGSGGLQAIIATLDRFHADVGEKLDTILDLSRRIRGAAESAVASGS